MTRVLFLLGLLASPLAAQTPDSVAVQRFPRTVPPDTVRTSYFTAWDTNHVTVVDTVWDTVSVSLPGDSLPSVVTCSGVNVAPGESIQAAVTAAGVGDTFCLKAGVHRGQSVVPKNNQTFLGETGTVLTGGKMVTTWNSDGSGRWYASGQTQQGATFTAGVCLDGFPRCHEPEQLLVDSVLYVPVAALADLASGKFYFDYAADRIYLSENPVGKVIEASVTNQAFKGSADSVLIQGLTVQLYSAAGQGTGAIEGGDGWTLEDVVTRWNHGTGARVGSRWTLRRVRSLYNGQLCLSAAGGGVLAKAPTLEDSELAYCNTAGFNPGFAAGGMKWVSTDSARIRRNHVHHNAGNGIWLDIGNLNADIDSNEVTDQVGHGIFCEIGDGCRVRWNVVRRNQKRPDEHFQSGAGIMCSATSGCEIAWNTVEDNYRGIILLQQDRGAGNLVENADVHHNTVSQCSGDIGFKGGDPLFLTGRNNRFRDNTYTLCGTAKYFLRGSLKTDAEWKAAGQDVAGTFTRVP